MKFFLILFLFSFSTFSLTSQNFYTAEVGYDVILVAGQSNTHYGYPLDPKIDTVNSKVYSLQRNAGLDYRIAPAKSHLDFWTAVTNRVSFATNFSNIYVNNLLRDSKRRVLIIPCGYAGSSIVYWTKGNFLYTDAINRVNYVLDNIPGSQLVAILWHQGEANVGWNQYQTTLDKMINDMRSAINQENSNEIPFILGGMVPFWANYYPVRKQQQAIIKGTPDRVPNTAYADPEFPTVIAKPNNFFDDIHFDAAGQREMGVRYFVEFVKMTNSAIDESLFVKSTLEEPVESAVSVYPNPTSDVLNIKAKEVINQIKMYDLNNQLVFDEKFYDKEVTASIGHFRKGVYLVAISLEKGKKVESLRIIKE